jgi:hypothetical protein
MSICIGNNKNGGKCSRRADIKSEYCWQHKVIYDEKQLNMITMSESRISNKPLNLMITRASTENTYLCMVFEQNVLFIINSFFPIPEGISKLFSLSSRLKYEYLTKKLNNENFKISLPHEIYLNKLYTFLTIKSNFLTDDKHIKKLLISEIYYDEIYIWYMKSTDIAKNVDFLFYLYSEKYFKYFYILYFEFRSKYLTYGLKIDHDYSYSDEESKKYGSKNLDKMKIIFNFIDMDILTNQIQLDK